MISLQVIAFRPVETDRGLNCGTILNPIRYPPEEQRRDGLLSDYRPVRPSAHPCDNAISTAGNAAGLVLVLTIILGVASVASGRHWPRTSAQQPDCGRGILSEKRLLPTRAWWLLASVGLLAMISIYVIALRHVETGYRAQVAPDYDGNMVFDRATVDCGTILNPGVHPLNTLSTFQSYTDNSLACDNAISTGRNVAGLLVVLTVVLGITSIASGRHQLRTSAQQPD